MPRTAKPANSLHQLLDRSARPVYAVDSHRRIAYCNPALAAWLDLAVERIVGRVVEFHSEPADTAKIDAAPLADLCPPPRALAGEPCTGTISRAARGGRLAHRHAEFIPLRDESAGRATANNGHSVLVILAATDLTLEELTAEVGETSPDELHRAIRRFRRQQAGRYSLAAILGQTPAIQKVRAQIAAAAASDANVLIISPPAAGSGDVARAVHYQAAAAETDVALVPVDCRVASADSLRRALEVLNRANKVAHAQATLLLENIENLSQPLQTELARAISSRSLSARIVATTSELSVATAEESPGKPIDPSLLSAISTITIRLPRLRDRLEDLPILAQSYLEACNRGSDKQVGSIRPEALDQLSLYGWPGELDELKDVIRQAHARCESHEIGPGDLPAVVHHAVQAASRRRVEPERIVLDDLLARIEREAVERALAVADGNKTEAAALLGMNRPRFYRRLVQLGLVAEAAAVEPEAPHFIEAPPEDDEP